MLAIRKDKPRNEKYLPNLLPCSIDHSGTVDVDKELWKSSANDEGNSVSYLRGRRIVGEQTHIPEGYQGMLLQSTHSALRTADAGGLSNIHHNASQDEAEHVEVTTMKQLASFDKILVWEHGKPPVGDDSHVKGLKEWIGFAEAVHQGHHQCSQKPQQTN
jgi:ribonuclease H2 subunit C